ncbi:hypothetical protein HPT27_07030 [Permianibacter sp. IMCC34836]|uniref:DUF5694 domain-containing protein n=1 Tax=Permianibacter fluminis TaxID=2738515 RepID=UPI0015554521|nr:DUF5694 domain-containing protein [Permianibacter fluminis]NQD36775.1 hypothetical protein [Permianibacter fluminis]
MKKLSTTLTALTLLFSLAFSNAQAAAETTPVAPKSATPSTTTSSAAPAKVMLLGLFHFNNPGLDAVKFETIDVLKPASQAYLQALTERLSTFKPTKVLLEYDPQNEAQMNQRYQDYLAGKFELERNEIYQLGFRVAKLAGLRKVSSFDERNVNWNSDYWTYMQEHDPEAMKAMENLIDSLSARFQHQHQTLSLRELLLVNNSPEEDRLNKDMYLLTNAVGASDGKYLGADASASWWQRNFRMYANIQLVATPGERVLVIAGQGHTAILRDLLRIDTRLVEEPVVPYL